MYFFLCHLESFLHPISSFLYPLSIFLNPASQIFSTYPILPRLERVLYRYIHPFGLYKRSLQPAHASPPAYLPGPTLPGPPLHPLTRPHPNDCGSSFARLSTNRCCPIYQPTVFWSETICTSPAPQGRKRIGMVGKM